MKKLNMTFKALLIGSFALLFGQAQAQDSHLSQFDASPVLLNPAHTGMFNNGDIRIAVNYRSQWGVLSSNFVTTGASFDMPFKDRWGVGGYLYNSDFANVINSLNFALSGAYQISDPNQQEYYLSAGLQLGFIYKRVNDPNLVFDNQYTNGLFDSDLPSGEGFQRFNRFMPDINIGFAYIGTDKSKQVNPYGGLALAHITTPNESFVGDESARMPIRWTLSGGAKIEINDDLMIDPNLLFMRQRTFTEINVGALAFYHLNETNYHILGGLYYRHHDAFILHAGLKHLNNIYRISYDINTSGLNQFSNKRGGVEFSVIYTGRRKPKSATFME